MLQLFYSITKFIPYDCYQDVFSINYNKLYEDGKRIILMDIDNTLIPYDQDLPSPKIKDFIEKLKKIGFKIILFSNNGYNRVSKFSEACSLPFINNAVKPFGKGYRKALKLAKSNNLSEYIGIGDQLMTDVLGGNRFGIEVILVRPLKKRSEKWYTKINRINERHVLRKLKNSHSEIYKKIEGIYL
jgi:hypothetical protein